MVPMRKSFVVLCVVGLLPAAAQGGERSLTVGPLVSIQDSSYDGVSSVYLDNGLQGNAPGLFVSFRQPVPGSTSLGVEVSTTRSFGTRQSGRFVGCGGFGDDCREIEARGLDTIGSVLIGVGSPTIEARAGLSGVWTLAHQAEPDYQSYFGLGLTGGVDANVRVGGKLMLVPIFRYTYAFRAKDLKEDYEMGRHIFRVGVGVRFGL
jgi:hypothetical protein